VSESKEEKVLKSLEEIGFRLTSLEAAVSRDRLSKAATDLFEACKVALRQIEDLDESLNQPSHEVVGWHLNGETEPIESFFHDNDLGAAEKLRAAIQKAEMES
jgi:hypothetical protein